MTNVSEIAFHKRYDSYSLEEGGGGGGGRNHLILNIK